MNNCGKTVTETQDRETVAKTGKTNKRINQMSIRQKLIGLLWTLGFSGRPDRTIHRPILNDKELKEDRKKEQAEEMIRLMERRGLKPFEVGSHVVWALNLKNAQRKARKEVDRLLSANKGQ